MRRIKRELIHQDFLTVVRNTYEAPNGQPMIRELVEHPGAAVIIPMIGKEEVLLIEQFRPGASRKLIELPAGLLEPNEDPRDCAARELIEETGYKARNIEHLFSSYSSPGILQEQFHMFLATELEQGEAKPQPYEFIELRPFTFRDLRIQLRSGNIKDTKTIAGLCYLLAFKPYLGATPA